MACHYEDVWTKLPKMMFAKSQEERETLVKMLNWPFLSIIQGVFKLPPNVTTEKKLAK